MNVLFNRLLSTVVSHDYYSEGITGDFDIMPSPGCSAVLNNYGLLFRRAKTGFTVLYMTEAGSSNTPVKKINNDIKFSFYLKLKNRLLPNFSDIPLDNATKSIFYFTNRNNNIQNSELLLSAGTSDQYVSDIDRVALKPKSFLYTQTYPNATAAVSVAGIDGNEVLNDSVNSIKGTINYNVDLSGYQPGIYKLKVDGAVKLNFYADDAADRENIFGIIEIFNDAAVPLGYRMTDASGNIAEKKYSVNFASRKTFWKYFIVLKYRNSVNPADLSLTYPDATNNFTKQTQITLSDGNPAIPFISDQLIPMKEKGIKGIKLEKTNGGGSGLFEIDNLPNASIEHLSPDPVAGKVYSEIFIYI